MTRSVEISGVWYPAGSAKRIPATLRGAGERYLIETEDGIIGEGLLKDAVVSRRVGNIPRSLTLNDQSRFETSDNDAVDAWIGHTSSVTGSGLLHQMETRWSWIIVSLIAVVMFVYAGGRWGLPWASEKIAHLMPERFIEYVSDGSLELLDRFFLEPSELSSVEQARIRSRLAETYGDQYRVHFRELGMPNAFALPDGNIVVTDAFVALATEAEFDAVFLHEIGHVVERHGIQQLVRTSIVTFLVAIIVGDPSGLEEVVVGLPVFLMQSHYSREHETSADEYAFQEMMERGIDPIHFATIMEKMERYVDEADDDQQTETPPAQAEPGTSGKPDSIDPDNVDAGVTHYLSSHPATRDRILRARDLSAQFRIGGNN